MQKQTKSSAAQFHLKKIEDYQIHFDGNPSAVGLPHTVDSLLNSVARNNTVILTAASYTYKNMIEFCL
jgi:hypothetical protein